MRFAGYWNRNGKTVGRLNIEFEVTKEDLVKALMVFWESGGTSLLGGGNKTREAVIKIYSAIVKQKGAVSLVYDPSYEARLAHAENMVKQLFPEL